MTIFDKTISTDLRAVFKKYSGWHILFFAVWVWAFYFFQHKSFFTNSDGIYQQYQYFAYTGVWIRRLINNIFVKHVFEIPMWDMSIGMGADPIVTFGVGADPLYWFSAFIPVRFSEYAFDAMIVFKYYLIGLSYCCFLHNYGLKGNSIIAGALVYTFSATTFIGLGQTGFINHYILFPLLMIGVDRLWKGKGYRFYVISLIFATLNSYYLLYMMGLMVIVYCILRFLVEKTKLIELPRLLFRFLFPTLFGIGIAVGFVVPSIMNLSKIDRLGQKFELSPVDPGTLKGILFNAFSDKALFHDSFWGCSSILFISLVLLFMKKNEKLLLKILIILFTVSLGLPFIGSVFNGFSFPTDRYVFGLILLVAYIVAVEFDDLHKFRGKIWYISLVISFIYLILAVILYDLNGALSGISLVITVVMTGWYNTKLEYSSSKAPLFYLFVIFISIAAVSVTGFKDLFWYVDIGNANKILYESTGADLVIERDDIDDIRFDYIPYSYDMEPLNSSMVLNLNGYDFYHSNYNNDLDSYYDSLAVVSNPIGYSYSGMRGRNFLELMNGSRYLLCYEEKDTGLKPPYSYEHISSEEVYGLYAASTDVSIVYFYDDFVSSSVYDQLSPISREELLMQRCVTDEGGSEMDFVPQHNEIGFTVAETENVEFIADDSFTVTDKGYILLEFEDVSDKEISLYLDGLNSDSSYVVVPSLMHGEDYISADFLGGIDVNSFYYHGKDTFLFNFGYCEDTVDGIKLIFTVPGNYTLNDIKIYTRDSEQLDAMLRSFYDQACMDDIAYELDGNHIRINAYADKDKYLYIAVPDSEGWTAYIDGEKADIIKANSAFMALPVSQGEHEVELDYFTPYLKTGLICSLISVIGFGIYEFCNKKKKEA